MLGLEKSTVKKKNSQKGYAFDSFSIEKKANAMFLQQNMNCECRDGALRCGVGVTPVYNDSGGQLFYNTTTDLEGIFVGRLSDGTLVVFLARADGGLYGLNITSGEIAKRVTLGVNVTHCTMRDENGNVYLLFSGDTGAYCTINGRSFIQIALGEFVGSCTAGRRFFIATQKGVLYSKPLNPRILDEGPHDGGELNLPSGEEKVFGICSLEEKVYLFTERSVFRLSVSAKATDFRLEKLAFSGGYICKRSAIAVGEGIIFLAEDGAYRLHGEQIEQIHTPLHIRPYDVSTVCKTGCCEGYALIEYVEKTASGEQHTVRLAISSDGKRVFVTDNFGCLGGNEYTGVLAGVHRFTCADPTSLYRRAIKGQSVEMDFGSTKRKRLRKIRLQGEGSVRVDITANGSTHQHVLAFSDGKASASLYSVGERFTFGFYLSPGSEIRSGSVEYHCLEE